MIRNFFVLSPRGDTILAKQYRTGGGSGRDVGSHERSHTEALFRTIKFWDDSRPSGGGDDASDAIGDNSGDAAAVEAATDVANSGKSTSTRKRTGDAPPVMLMQDGFTYFHVKRNGLIFGASSAKNVSPNTVLEVRLYSTVVQPIIAELGLVLVPPATDRTRRSLLLALLVLVRSFVPAHPAPPTPFL